MSGVRNTGLMTLVWKDRARQPSFWGTTHGNTTRQKPLFNDDLMKLFVNDDAITEAEKLDPKLALAIAVRHKFFTKEISTTIKNNAVKQIVLLGSGYDTRPVRKKKYSDQFDVKFFEVDQADVLARKRDIYQQNNIDPNAVHIGINYINEDLISHLSNSGLDLTAPTHFIWEGNTFYLTPAQIEKTLTQIKQAFTGTLYISFDYIDKAAASVAEVNNLKQNLANSDAAWQSEINDFHQEITDKLGFTIVKHRPCSDMTTEYGVGDDPYESQKSYFLCTLRK